MVEYALDNPAQKASYSAFVEVCDCIDKAQCFELRAGAGAGKTFTLCNALRYLIDKRGRDFIRLNQRVACITYTNVARDEIGSRIDHHPAVVSDTIHSFCWSLIKNFQPALRSLIPGLSEKWRERLVEKELADVGSRNVVYTEGHPYISDNVVSLHHNDVPSLTVSLMSLPKFQNYMFNKFPVIFIDEYQDTNSGFASALLKFFIESGSNMLVGFFGDPWQKIYGDGFGEVNSDSVRSIGLGSNFRSASSIVNVLNAIRPELPQEVTDPQSVGELTVITTNSWSGVRRTGHGGGHWTGDLPAEEVHRALHETQAFLSAQGWNFDLGRTKILMLTHNVLASEQGYSGLLSSFGGNNDALLKLEHPHIAFFANVLVPAIEAYRNCKYGEMFDILQCGAMPSLQSNEDKYLWKREWDHLLSFDTGGDGVTIGHLIDFVIQSRTTVFPDNILELERKLTLANQSQEEREREISKVTELRRFKEVAYVQFKSFLHFLDENCLFSTKHGVKGAEFDDVLVVLGRGWNKYNWDQLLKWGALDNVEKGKEEAFIRNRNLFYVSCSRSKKRLCLLFTQKLSDEAVLRLHSWFDGAVFNPIEFQ